MWGWLFFLTAWTVFLDVQSAGVGAGRLVCYVENARVTDDFSECSHLVYAGDVRGDKLDDFLKEFRKNNPRIKILLRVYEVDKEHRELLKSKRIQGLEIYDVHRTLNKTKVTEAIQGARSAIRVSGGGVLFLALPAYPELLAKYYDIRELVKIVDLMTVQTHALGFVKKTTYHPSRLSGLWDMMNTDSIVDLVVGLGVPASQIVISLPATAYRFTLLNETLSTPGSPAVEDSPEELDQKELCKLLKQGRWTLERDEDLSAPYTFKNKTWISFEDASSVDVKVKYARVRGLAGLALHRTEYDMKTTCGPTLRASLKKVLNQQSRAPRAAVLRSLEHDILSAPSHIRALDALQVSPYRITQVVDADGVIHSIRGDTRTEFACSRQGYFVHPRSCGRFYRCVKFDQLSPDYTVFEFDCPAGLAFDSRYEVCVWPGSLPHSQACPGSSEIAPVPQTRFICPEREGYYVDPENCRWFFACLDHGKSPLSAYEFRCPFGLGFDPDRLKCDWPWLVPACGNIGRYEAETHGFSAAVLTGAAGFQGQTADDVNIAAHQSLISGAALDNLVGIQGSYITKGNNLDSRHNVNNIQTLPETYAPATRVPYVYNDDELAQSGNFDDYAYQLGEASFWDKSVIEADKKSNYYRNFLGLDDYRSDTTAGRPISINGKLTTNIDTQTRIIAEPNTLEVRPATFTNTPATNVDTQTSFVDKITTINGRPITLIDTPSTVETPTTVSGKSKVFVDTPNSFINTPTTIFGTPTTYYGTPTTFVGTPAISGRPTTFVDTPATFSDAPSTFIGTETTINGKPTTFVNTPTAFIDTPATIVGTPATIIGTPATIVGTSKITGRPTAYTDTPTTVIRTPISIIGTPTTINARPATYTETQTNVFDTPTTINGAQITVTGRPTTVFDGFNVEGKIKNSGFVEDIQTRLNQNDEQYKTEYATNDYYLSNAQYQSDYQTDKSGAYVHNAVGNTAAPYEHIESQTVPYIHIDSAYNHSIHYPEHLRYLGSYQPDHRGKYVPDHSGRYNPDYSGQYFENNVRNNGQYFRNLELSKTDHKGKYFLDTRGHYYKDNLGHYMKTGDEGKYIHEIYSTSQNDHKGKYTKDERGRYNHDNLGHYFETNTPKSSLHNGQYLGFGTFTLNDNKGKYIKDEQGKYVDDATAYFHPEQNNNKGNFFPDFRGQYNYNTRFNSGQYVAPSSGQSTFGGDNVKDNRGQYIHQDTEYNAQSGSNGGYFTSSTKSDIGDAYAGDQRGKFTYDDSGKYLEITSSNGNYNGQYDSQTYNEHKGLYKQDQRGKYVQEYTNTNPFIINNDKGKYAHDFSGQYVHNNRFESGQYASYSSGKNDFKGKYIKDNSGQYVHTSNNAEVNNKGTYRPDKLGSYTNDYFGKYDTNLNQYGDNKNYWSDSKIFTGAPHILAGGSINVDLIGKTTLVNAGYVEHTTPQNKGILQPSQVQYVSQPAVLISHDGTDIVNHAALNYISTPTPSIVPSTIAPFSVTKSAPVITTYKPVFAPEPPKSSIKQIFGIAQPLLSNIHKVNQKQLSSLGHSELGYQYQKPTNNNIDNLSITTPTSLVSVSKFVPQGFSHNQHTIHKIEDVGLNYASAIPITEEPFKKVISYTTGPSATTTFGQPTVATFTSSTPSSVVPTYPPQIIAQGSLHQVDANLVKTYKGSSQIGHNYQNAATPTISSTYLTSTPIHQVDLTYHQPSVSVFQNPVLKYTQNVTPVQPIPLPLNPGYSNNQPEIQRDTESTNIGKSYSDARLVSSQFIHQNADSRYVSGNSASFSSTTPGSLHLSSYPGTKITTIYNQVSNQSPEIQAAYDTEEYEYLPPVVSTASPLVTSSDKNQGYSNFFSTSEYSPISKSAGVSREYLPPVTTTKPVIKSTTQIPSPKFVVSTTPYVPTEYLPPKEVGSSVVTFESFGLEDRFGSSTAKINYNPYQEYQAAKAASSVEPTPSSTGYRKHNIVIEKAKSNLLGFGTVGPDAGLVSPVTYTTETNKIHSSTPKVIGSTYATNDQSPLLASSTSEKALQKVAVVTKINDFNPPIVKKLEAVCSCQSPVVVLKGKRPDENSQQTISDYADYDEGQGDQNSYKSDRSQKTITIRTRNRVTPTLNPIIVPDDSYYQDFEESTKLNSEINPNDNRPSFTGFKSSNPRVLSTTSKIIRNGDETIAPSYKSVPVTTASGTRNYDRYGPGGWRSREETLQGSVDCQRAGLFRHPKECNKFYACRWDDTKERFTLHVFNCPVQLSFDSKIGACNWPSQGPTCQGDTLLTNSL